ncbi:hypothetical protein [Mucilaginibacter gossypii]|uniref:Uncharacterized protein n=1 Tax=Mucilaginibacter gossypii TaxID=551996 RepID=A0A1G8CY19_9SPHI|nr:hypothetical protein [Mucilaginibacter gossypii]SDH50332.1 hypothetical protein SAMN05192573_11070 [Mucilaginibacter gossypii]
MIIKKALFIADEDVDETVEKIASSLKARGITLQHQHIDLREDSYKRSDPTNGNKIILDFSKIKDKLTAEYFKVDFDLVACDFNYGNDPQLDGFEVVKWLKNEANSKRERIRKAKFILYSSQQEKLIPKTNTIDQLTKLINVKIDDFIDRRRLAEVATKILGNTDKDITAKFLVELDRYKTHQFKSVYPKFAGKTLEEIAHEIDKATEHGVGFQDHLIELLIAHLIELN